MSRRRLARSGRPQAARERAGLPDALRDHRDPLWHDAEAVADLARAYRLTVTDPRYRSLAVMPWWARFDAFRDAWCRTRGLMCERWHGIDWHRAREAGIDLTATARYRLRALPPQTGPPPSTAEVSATTLACREPVPPPPEAKADRSPDR